MAHYAFLDENNVVTQIIVGKEETELIDGISPEQWYENFAGKRCIRTSYNGNIRKRYASIGGKYDPTNDVFIGVQPYPSWALDGNHDWQPPIPKPEGSFYWDEETLAWVETPAI